jgi:hypothetical protein
MYINIYINKMDIIIRGNPIEYYFDDTIFQQFIVKSIKFIFLILTAIYMIFTIIAICGVMFMGMCAIFGVMFMGMYAIVGIFASFLINPCLMLSITLFCGFVLMIPQIFGI